MRVIAKSTLARFWSEPAYADSKSALQSWHNETIAAHRTTPQDIKAHYRNASICPIAGWSLTSLATNIASLWKFRIAQVLRG